MYSILPISHFNVNLTGSWQNISENSSYGFCEQFLIFSNLYIILAISGIGMILNVLNLIAFFKMSKKLKTESMSKYLFVKSLFDFVYCLINFTYLLLSIYGQHTYSYSHQAFILYGFLYFKNVFIFMSIVSDCAAIVDRYLLVSGRMKWMYKIIVFNRGIPILTIIGLSLYSNKFVEYRIMHFPHFNSSYLSEKFQWTINGNGVNIELSLVFQLIQTTITNFILTSLIIIFNTLTLVELKKMFKSKRTLVV